jgi:hypothetical protein
MTRPNITVRSNVFVRSGAELRSDHTFILQVRGRSALLQLLKQLEPNVEPITTARKFLSRTQLAQVAWQSACGVCGGYPEGPVTRNGVLEVQFRCPRQACTASEFTARTVVLSLELVRRCSEVFKKPIDEIIQSALKAYPAQQTNPEVQPCKCLRVPVVVRLTLAQRYFLTDRDIESAVTHLLCSREPS